MFLRIAERGIYTVFHCDADIAKKPVLDQAESSVSAGKKHLVLDFSNATIFSSLITELLNSVYQKLSAVQGTLSVVLSNPEVIEAFNSSGMQLLIKRYGRIDELPGESVAGDSQKEKPVKDLTYLISTKKDGFRIIKAKDTLDLLEAATEFRTVVDQNIKGGETKFIVDFGGLDSISSHIIACIADAYQKVKIHKGEICICAHKAELRQTIDFTGLSGFVQIYKDHEEMWQEISGFTGDRKDKLILVVDDSQTMRDIVVGKVKKLGYSALTAINGKDGVQKAIAHKPDLVLMDIQMPEMDGFSACKEIKAKLTGKTVPVIFVTTLTEPKERLNALEAGGDDFINKPVQDEDLMFRIKTHLKIGELNQNLKDVNENLEKIVAQKSQALVETERQLIQTEKMGAIGTMLSGIAHELKNPIIVIGGRVQMLRDRGGLTDWQEKSLKHIENEICRADTIVSNLMKMVKQSTERVSFLDINEFISNIKSNFAYIDTRKSIDYHFDLKAEGRIKANASEMEQVLINLIANSVDAVSEKGVIRISTFDEPEWRCISIDDDGIGMTQEIQRKMFDPFFTTKELGKGGGLGMSIVYRIIRSHRGMIRVKSKQGKGTKVLLYFPKI